MIKKILLGILLVAAFCSFSEKASSQSIYFADKSVYVRKSGNNRYIAEKSEHIYRFEQDGSVLLTKPGTTDLKVAYYKREADGRISYYDDLTSTYAGSYYPSTKRFLDMKENTVAVLSPDNEVFNSSGEAIFTVDKAIPIEVLGFFIYFNY